MKTAVFGDSAAALNTAIKIASAGNDVQLVCDGLNREGVTAITYDKMRGKYDVIVFIDDADNKLLSWQTGQFLKPDGYIITLQPGAPEEELKANFGENRVVFGIYGEDKILLEASQNAEKAASLLASQICENITEKRFSSMCEAAFGGISSVAGCSMELICANEAWINIMVNTAKEFFAICEKKQVYGLTLNGYIPADLLTMRGFFKKKYPAKKICAAVPDYSKKTPVSEFEAIVSYAKACGTDAPYCNITLRLLKGISSGKIKRGPANVKSYLS